MEEVSSAEKPTMLVRDGYTPKSFVVYGDTKSFKDTLKSLGGRFNGNLTIDGVPTKGWVFPTKSKEVVLEAVTRLNSGQNADLPNQNSEVTSDLPTIATPPRLGAYQYVKFKIYKPHEGQFVDLKTEGKTIRGRVLKTETHDDIVDTVYIDFNGQTSLCVICNQRFQIFGYTVPHSIFFTDK